MAKKDKNEKEKLDDVVVEAENKYDFSTVKFEDVADDKKPEVFEQMKKANVMMMTMLKECEKQMTALEAKSKGKVSDETYMRLMADYDNYKRRNSTSRSEGYNDGQDEVLIAMVEIVDNFERAMPMIQDESVLNGIKMIYKQFIDKLTSFNVKEIECLGKPFDPELHNAVMQGEAESEDKIDTVMEVLQKGYSKGVKVLRHAFVKVAK
ncbi:MAG: nucleotide exchange factor GrpE [Clostridia bacterium]